VNTFSVRGIFAAVLLSRTPSGALDEAGLTAQLEFLLSQGVCNFALNGATSEYCQTTPDELRNCLRIAKNILPGDASLLCGVGSSCLRDTLQLGKIAVEASVQGVLVPGPHFFPYTQGDLAAFAESVASHLPVPQLLYNLPQFTTGFQAGTTLELIDRCENIIGIKDSSGSLDTVRELTRKASGASRIIGNDGVLAQALSENVCDGVVSGVACVLPEVIQALFANPPGSPSFTVAANHLKEFIAHIDVLPTPWGLKAIAEERGITRAVYPLPLSPVRRQQIAAVREWFREWSVDVPMGQSKTRVKMAH